MTIHIALHRSTPPSRRSRRASAGRRSATSEPPPPDAISPRDVPHVLDRLQTAGNETIGEPSQLAFTLEQ
jgi:hypothetical protein